MCPVAKLALAAVLLPAIGVDAIVAENWPRWRGPGGNAVSSERDVPVRWSREEYIRWSADVPGEGSSSPIVWESKVFLTSAVERGSRRLVHCLDVETGRIRWSQGLDDDNPEVTSALTGHAAATPVADDRHVVAFFGNAGVVCYDHDGRRLWHRDFGDFESELGLASSPILYRDNVILVCDHDGDRFGTFDSFLIALDAATGRTRWKTDRPEQFRSWSTPILIPSPEDCVELVVNAQDELCGYDPSNGKHLWTADGMTGWVTPSPVFGKGLIFATSGKSGPTLAVRPGGRGNVSKSHVAWRHDRGGPYVCSPLLVGDELYVHTQQGVLTCYDAGDGTVHYRRRLDGKFTASGVAAEGRVYLTSEDGTAYVITAGPTFELLATNRLNEFTLASPAIAAGSLFVRTENRLYRIGAKGEGNQRRGPAWNVQHSAFGAQRPTRSVFPVER